MTCDLVGQKLGRDQALLNVERAEQEKKNHVEVNVVTLPHGGRRQYSACYLLKWAWSGSGVSVTSCAETKAMVEVSFVRFNDEVILSLNEN